MAYAGRATYSSPTTAHEDVADLVSANSILITPLLDFIGDAPYPAENVKHEWLTDPEEAVSDLCAEPMDNSETTMTMTDGTKFRIGDILRHDDELYYVSGVSTNDLTITRGYGSSTAATHDTATSVVKLGYVPLEGEDADAARNNTRTRVYNYTQPIRSRTIDVSFAQQCTSTIGVTAEYEHQKEQAVRECLASLERFAIHGRMAASTPQGSASVRRTMQGLRKFISTNAVSGSSAALTETLLNSKWATAWDNGMRTADFILCGSYQKMVISAFKRSEVMYAPGDETQKIRTLYYHNDFTPNPCRVILDPWMDADEIIIGDSSRFRVLPLKGASFQHFPLAVSGDYIKGFVQGEYTVEVLNEEAFALIYSLATS
jgi:hypothetical protein